MGKPPNRSYILFNARSQTKRCTSSGDAQTCKWESITFQEEGSESEEAVHIGARNWTFLGYACGCADAVKRRKENEKVKLEIGSQHLPIVVIIENTRSGSRMSFFSI